MTARIHWTWTFENGDPTKATAILERVLALTAEDGSITYPIRAREGDRVYDLVPRIAELLELEADEQGRRRSEGVCPECGDREPVSTWEHPYCRNPFHLELMRRGEISPGYCPTCGRFERGVVEHTGVRGGRHTRVYCSDAFHELTEGMHS